MQHGIWKQPTSGLCPGYEQANVVVIPRYLADEFKQFCELNPKPCPVLEIIEGGRYLTQIIADRADIRSHIPKYYIYKYGLLYKEITDVTHYWQQDFVTFLLGCSFSFEEAMVNASIPVRNIEENKNVSIYYTNIACKPAGSCSGNLIVSMRPVAEDLVQQTIELTGQFTLSHGVPVHIGSPHKIGITDLSTPDFGDSVTIKAGEIPLFWACGVTPLQIITKAKPPIAITHKPGHMLITDRPALPQ